MQETMKLTLTPDMQEEKKEEPVVETAPPAGPEMERLSPEEQKMVSDFSQTIDITNSQQILQYGAGAQKNIADFSETALGTVRTKD